MSRCLDCGAELGALVHCGQCGQRASVARLTWRDSIRDIRDQFMDGNLPWIATLKGLTLDPGTLAKRYVGGQRTRYVHPLKFAFYGVLIYTFVLSAGGAGELPWPELPYWRRFLATNIPLYVLLITPVAVLSLRVCFLRIRVNAIETWVLVLYVLGWLALFEAVVQLGIAGATRFFPRNDAVNLAIGMISLFTPLFYFMYAAVRFYQTRMYWALLGGLVALTVSTAVGFLVYIYWLIRPAWGG